jgi:mannosyltransferase OCH1-like enzyme
VCLCFLLFLAHRYLDITVNILFRGPYIATYHSDHLRISQERDGFDITFASYSSQPPKTTNYSAAVPAIIHDIMLGSNSINSTGLQMAHQTCVDMHPGYQFMSWNDENAAEFVASHFPDLYPMWSSYRFVIQKADSLRYMVLYVYGGKRIPNYMAS